MAIDIYTEPEDVDLDTLRNLGPLEPIDPQPNGPQLLYGLRYHVHVNKLDEPLTFHDQVGYWLWEPATRTLLQTIAIPRGQVALASGTADPGARTFTVRAALGSPTAGIVSAPFVHENFRTLEYAMTVTVSADGTFAYEQDTVLQVAGRPVPFHHTDRNVLRRIAPPAPNPAAPARPR